MKEVQIQIEAKACARVVRFYPPNYPGFSIQNRKPRVPDLLWHAHIFLRPVQRRVPELCGNVYKPGRVNIFHIRALRMREAHISTI